MPLNHQSDNVRIPATKVMMVMMLLALDKCSHVAEKWSIGSVITLRADPGIEGVYSLGMLRIDAAIYAAAERCIYACGTCLLLLTYLLVMSQQTSWTLCKLQSYSGYPRSTTKLSNLISSRTKDRPGSIV